MAEMTLPLAVRDFFRDERVGGVGIGNAQQRLRNAHQDDAFFARQAIFVHEGVDAGMLAFVDASGMHETARQFARAAAFVFRVDGALDQAANQTGFVDEVVLGDLFAGIVRALALGMRGRSTGSAQRHHSILDRDSEKSVILPDARTPFFAFGRLDGRYPHRMSMSQEYGRTLWPGCRSKWCAQSPICACG
jgi:hypothetical protein